MVGLLDGSGTDMLVPSEHTAASKNKAWLPMLQRLMKFAALPLVRTRGHSDGSNRQQM